jgi:hypothetical protein
LFILVIREISILSAASLREKLSTFFDVRLVKAKSIGKRARRAPGANLRSRPTQEGRKNFLPKQEIMHKRRRN